MTAARLLFPIALVAALAVPAAVVRAAVPEPQLPAPPLQLPSSVERTLPNGLRVVVFPTGRLPIVHVQLLVRAGSSAEPDDHAGVAALTVALLRQGTPSRSAAQLAADFSQLGASFATSCTRDYALVACGARREAFDGTLEVMSDAAINPLFGGDAFESARDGEARRGTLVRGTLADAADARLAQLLFAPHPYAHEPAGDPAALARLDLPTVQAFHRDRWRPDRSVLVIAGDVNPEHAFAVAGDWFGRWTGHSAPERSRPTPRPAPGVRVFDSPGAPLAEVRVAVAGPGTASVEHDAWALAGEAFATSKLLDGARVTREDARDASTFVLAATVPPAQAAAAAQALVRAFKTFASAPPEGDALAALRRRVAQRYPLTIGTLGAFVSQWQALDFAGPRAGDIAGLGARQAAADIAAGARAFAATPAVLVAGPAATLRAPLAAAGLGAVSVDSAAVSPAAAEASSNAPPTPEMRARGRAALAAAVAAHGGAAAIAGVHSLIIEGTITLRMAGQDMSGQFSTVRVDPDRFSFATKILNMESRQLTAGGRGWAFLKTDSTKVVALDSIAIGKLRASAAADLVHELRMATAPEADAVWRGTGTIADHTCDLVDYATPWGRQRMSIDTVTHRVLEMASTQGPGGAWLDRRQLSDFRTVNGILLPWVEERAVRGERAWRMNATAVDTNREIPGALFERPSTTP